MKNNILYVAHGEEDKLYSKGLITGKINFIPEVPSEKEFECYAKFRYRQDDQKVSVKVRADGSTEVVFAEKQRAITEGQYCVFYDDEKCLGGGVIEKALF
jgi:tRNA-specific 2-thiouridylase